MKRRSIWVVAAAGVVLLASLGTAVGLTYSNQRSEPVVSAGAETENGSSQPLDEPSAPTPSPSPSGVPGLPTPTPSPIADAPAAPDGPKVVTSPSPSPSEGPRPTQPPVADGPGAENQPPAPGQEPETTPPGGDEPDDGLGEPAPPAEIILGQTIDEVGTPHTLVLNVADDAGSAMIHTANAFAVISGSSRFSVTGDAAVDDWRFAVDASNAGTESPIVVIKEVPGSSMQDLAADPRAFTSGAALNEDPVAISTRLSALIAEVISNAEPTQPNWSLYAMLAQHLTDPSWRRVMIFNASATVPAEVQGRPTGALAGSDVGVLNLGFEAPMITGDPAPSRVFATIDQADDSGDALPPGVLYLRAGFVDSGLTAFEQGLAVAALVTAARRPSGCGCVAS